jgi:hypothetical protein
MQQVTASDFSEWKSNPVTKAFYLAIRERIEDAKEVLSTQAGFNNAEDSFFRGFISAYRECLEFRIDDLQEAVE